MRCLAVLLLVLVAAPARAETRGFDAALLARVFTAALDFVAPRSLDPVTVAELAGWGLRGIAALDPALTAGVVDGKVQVSGGTGVIHAEPAPQETSGPAAWGGAIAAAVAAAASVSEPVRRASTEDVLQSVFDEMFNHLDPYSRYVAPVAADADRARRNGEAGAGLTLAEEQGGIAIRAVNANGTGAEAGLRAGDRLLSVDGRPTSGQALETVEDWIAGDEGTLVALVVRTARGQVRRVQVERVVTPPETVFASRLGDLLLLRVAFFAEDTDARIGAELARAVRGPRPVRGAILDLRDNHGGQLRQAVAASVMMLGSGVVVTTAGRDRQASHVWRGEGSDLLAGRPVVVLVDGRSASAAEIVAAALADRGRAVVTGSVSYGKGLVQAVTTLPDGGELFVSWSRLLAPGGWPLQGLGVMPQVCTSLGEAALREQLDALGTGKDLLGPALARSRAARAPLPEAEAVEIRQACPASTGRDADLDTARWLLAHPQAYRAALLPGAMR